MALNDLVTNAPADDFWFFAGFVVVLATAGFISTFVFLFRKRLIEDLPTSKIRSAAQGYIELEGTAEKMQGPDIIAPLTASPCVWYSYKIEKYVGGKNDKWRTVEEKISDELFTIRDDTGRCIIDPDDAIVTPSKKDVWLGSTKWPSTRPKRKNSFFHVYHTGQYRYTERRIHDGDLLYALGNFKTMGGAADAGDPIAEVRELLAAWKKDQASLLARFDTDNDGKIDLDEWNAARMAAKKEVANAHNERKSQPGIETLSATGDRRRPFILSTILQDEILRRYQVYTRGSLAGFLISGTIAVWMIGVRMS